MATTINGSTGVITNSGAVYDGLQRGTAVASTSGTSIDFTGIPSWAKRVTVMFDGVSVSGTSSLLVQLGSTTFTTTGYISTGSYGGATGGTVNSTSGMVMFSNSLTSQLSGQMVLTNISSNNWVSSHTAKFSTQFSIFGGGDVNLSGTLDRIRITTVNGTDTFDAGLINIMYE